VRPRIRLCGRAVHVLALAGDILETEEMTLSRRKRRVRRHMRIERNKKDVYTQTGGKCKKCGKSLYDSLHHFYCNACWKEIHEWSVMR